MPEPTAVSQSTALWSIVAKNQKRNPGEQMSIVTPAWVKDAVFYQVFPDRFAKSSRFGRDGYPAKPSNLQEWGAAPTFHGFQGGDLLGVAEKLDYLVDLGINAIYLNPIFASASNHRYHTFDYLTVDPILGGHKAFAYLLQAAHKRNIRLILDGVFNHASRGFFQFNHLMECGSESPYVDWFHVRGWPVNAFAENQHPNYDAWWGMHSLPKFNTATPAVREYLWGVATHWLEQGIDGWRLDVPNEIDDDAFWQEFRRRCKAVNPEAYLVGELWGEAHRWLAGDQFDGQMNYMFSRSAFGFFMGDRIDQSDTVRCGYGHIAPRNGFEFAGDLDRLFNQMYHKEIVQAQMNMLGSHDTPRILSVANYDLAAVRLAFLCQMTVPGTPNIYYGDEIGMAGRRDPDCRRAFPWENKAGWNQDLRSEIKRYIALRHASPALRRGDFSLLHVAEDVVVYQRRHEQHCAVIAFNVSPKNRTFTVPADFPQALPEKLVDNGVNLAAGRRFALEGRSARVWLN
jgi:cyclomaltodextrinase